MNETEVKNLSSSMAQLTKQLEKNNAALLLASKETKNIEKETEKLEKTNKKIETSYKDQSGFLSTIGDQIGIIYKSAFKFSGLMTKIASGAFTANIIKDMIDLDDTMTAVSARMGKGGKDINVVGKNLFEMSQQSKKASNDIKDLNKEMLNVGKDGSFQSSSDSAKAFNDELSNVKDSVNGLSSDTTINFNTNLKDVNKSIVDGTWESGIKMYAETSNIDEYLASDKSSPVELKPLTEEMEKKLKEKGTKYVEINVDKKDYKDIIDSKITKDIKLQGDLKDLEKDLNGKTVEVDVKVDEKKAQEALNTATNTKTAVNNVQLLKDSVIDLQKEYGTSYENAKEYVSELAKMKYDGNIRDAAAGIDLYNRATGVAKGLTVELTNTLSKGADMSTGDINSMYASMAKVQQQVGISEKGMNALTQTINEMAANMTAFGKGSEEIKQMATQTTALVGALENVGISAQRSTQLINQLTDPDRIEDNILLYSQLGISMEDAMSGNFDLKNFDGQLKDMAQRIVDMGPIAGSSFAKSMGMTYKEAQRMANLEEGSMEAMGEAAKTTEEQSLDTLKLLVENTEGFGKTMESNMNKFEGKLKSLPQHILIGLLVLTPALIALGRSIVMKMFSKKKIQASVADGAKDGVKDIEKGALPSLENAVKKTNDKIKGHVKAAAPSMGKTFATWFTGTAVGGWLNGTEARMDALYKKAKAKPLSKAWLEASEKNLADQAQLQIEKAQAKVDTLAKQLSDVGMDPEKLKGKDAKELSKTLNVSKGKGRAAEKMLIEYEKAVKQAELLEAAENRKKGISLEDSKILKENASLQEEIAKRKQGISDKEQKISKLIGDRASTEKKVSEIEKQASKIKESNEKKFKDLQSKILAERAKGNKADLKEIEKLKEKQKLLIHANQEADKEAQKQRDQLDAMDEEIGKLNKEKTLLEDISDLSGKGGTDGNATNLDDLEKQAKKSSEEIHTKGEKPKTEKKQNWFQRTKESIGNNIKTAVSKTEWGQAAAASVENKRQAADRANPGSGKNVHAAGAYIGRAMLAPLKAGFKGLGKTIGGVGKMMGKGLGKMAKGIGGVMKTLGPMAILGMILSKLLTKIKDPLEKAIDQVVEILSPIIEALMPVIGTLLNVVATKILPPILKAAAGILDILHVILKPIVGILRLLGKLPWIGDIANGLADTVEALTDPSLTKAIRDSADKLAETSFNLEATTDEEAKNAEDENAPETIKSEDGGTLVSQGMVNPPPEADKQTSSVNDQSKESKSEETRKEAARDNIQVSILDALDQMNENLSKQSILLARFEQRYAENSNKKADVFSNPSGTILEPS